ncbi:MAG: Ig-like domain repeat protein [Propionibacteriaceae bacterium]|nr:Ig-like domain repeat protein [Propionibacteriaceae bacterium]
MTATLANGKASVTIPAKALEPGKHTVTVSYAGQAGALEPSSTTVQVTVSKATAKLKAKPSASKVKRGRTASFAVTVSASGVTPTGKVTVKVAGKSKTVTLTSSGKATVKITVPKSAKLGKQTIKVSHAGDGRVAAATATTSVKVVR